MYKMYSYASSPTKNVITYATVLVERLCSVRSCDAPALLPDWAEVSMLAGGAVGVKVAPATVGLGDVGAGVVVSATGGATGWPAGATHTLFPVSEACVQCAVVPGDTPIIAAPRW
jgi:hypothetical protein